MPYLYTLAYENHKYGWPIVRPIDFHQKGSLSYLSDQVFLFGKDIFVAPVLTDGQTSVEVVLPEGKWIDFETNETYNGLEPFELSVPTEKLPLFARSGTFIPMIQPIRSTDEYDTDTLIVKYYPDPEIPSNTYSLYDDDYQHTRGLEAGSYQLLKFEGIVGMDDLRILLDTIGSYDAMPSSREIYFQIERFRQPPQTVTVNGIELTSLPSESIYMMQENGWYYDNQSDRLHVHISWMGEETEIRISDPTLSNDQISKNNNTLNIFPNPTRDYISIRTMANLEGEDLLIFDQSGRQVKKLKVNGDKLYVGDLLSGLYTVRVNGRNWVKGTFIVM
jgi:oligosaccharide 4-alpha-D-glucosyltransferase